MYFTRLLLSLSLLASSAFATAIYTHNNGAPAGADGSEMTFAIQADDFQINSIFPVTLTGLTFWAVTGDEENAPLGFEGSISWFIYADATGSPGAILFSGSGTPTVSLRTTGVFGGINGLASYELSMPISAGPISAGTYWLGLHNGPLSFTEGQSSVYWEAVGPGNGKEQFNQVFDPSPAAGDAPWNPNQLDKAYILTGDFSRTADLPEPSALLLTALGLGALVIRRRA